MHHLKIPQNNNMGQRHVEPTIIAKQLPPKHHKPDGTFQNTGEKFKLPSWRKELVFDLTMFLMRKREPNHNEFPIILPDFKKIYKPDPTRIQYTWIGHSTFLLQIGGYNILTDPLLGPRCGPFKDHIGPIRLRPTPLTVDQLPPIDIVIISHDHFDHCDLFSLRDLTKKFKDTIHLYVPLKLKKWVQNDHIVCICSLVQSCFIEKDLLSIFFIL